MTRRNCWNWRRRNSNSTTTRSWNSTTTNSNWTTTNSMMSYCWNSMRRMSTRNCYSKTNCCWNSTRRNSKTNCCWSWTRKSCCYSTKSCWLPRQDQRDRRRHPCRQPVASSRHPLPHPPAVEGIPVGFRGGGGRRRNPRYGLSWNPACHAPTKLLALPKVGRGPGNR